MLKNITLKAEEALVRRAEEKAKHEHVSLETIFQRWLLCYVNYDYTKQDRISGDYETLMEQLSYAQAGRSFSRDELNER